MRTYINDMEKQKLIIRQNATNRAVDLLTSEQRTANSPAKIPIGAIEDLTVQIERLIWSVIPENDPQDNRTLNPQTGMVQQQQDMEM